jgi:hypothetical protein
MFLGIERAVASAAALFVVLLDRAASMFCKKKEHQLNVVKS